MTVGNVSVWILPESLPLGSAFKMYPRICLPLYHPDNYSPDLIPHHFFPGLSQLALTHLWSGSHSLLLPISLFPAHQPVWYYSVKPHWDLITFAQRAPVTPLATQTESQSLGSLTGSASCPLPCQMVLSSLCFFFYCCLHMLVYLPSGFCLPVTFMGKSFLTSVWTRMPTST